MEDNNVIVQADKTVVAISGLKMKGFNTKRLEEILKDRLKTLVRVIGVTGDAVTMDVYGVDEADILRDEQGIIKAVSLCEGVSVSDVVKISRAEKIKRADIEEIPPWRENTCAAERWLK